MKVAVFHRSSPALAASCAEIALFPQFQACDGETWHFLVALSVPGFKPRTCPPRHKLRYYVENLRSLLDLFPWKNTVTTNTADSCKSFSPSLSQTVTECGRIHTQVWKRIQTTFTLRGPKPHVDRLLR